MHTLLLRLAGPMQSWGTQSRFTNRDTGQEPSKSGTIGLLCAALGRPRTEPVDDLAGLSFGARVDREGTVKRDFHTVTGIARSSGGVAKYPLVTERFYLADAEFLVGFSGPDLDRLREIEAAVREPHWQLFLGRKSFAPSLPIALPSVNGQPGGLRENSGLLEALQAEPWRRRAAESKRIVDPERIRYVIEKNDPDRAERRIDQPAPGAVFQTRQFLPKYVRTGFWTLGQDVQKGEASDV
jgi:CRISPR system Cascade subunit CasD